MNQEDRYHTTSWDAKPSKQPPQGGKGGRSQHPAAGTGKKNTGGKKVTPLLSVILWVVIVVASAAILAGVGWNLANDMCALNKPYAEVTLEVPEAWIEETRQIKNEDGTTKEVVTYDMGKVADALKEEGLIEYKWFFRLFSKLYHGEQKVSQGTFTLNTGMDYMALIRGMRPGYSGGKAVTVDVTIPEGYSVQQIINLLAENGVATVEALTDAAANHVFEGYGFVDNENLGDITRLEGYLFPDRYNFYVGATASRALNSILSNFNKKVYADEEISALLENSGYSFEEIIAISSLIEKETDGSDREKIASVIYNRLKNAGETAHFLQIDAALVYAAGRPITQEDYANLNSPYNLYLHTGLPPTPIANPGLASIKAALEPAETDYYFYVLGKEGKHVFAKTLAEHQRNVANAAGG